MVFYGVLGEDDSGAEPVAVFIRRLRAQRGLAPVKVRPYGYDGCGQLLRKGAAQLKAWAHAGCTRAVICYDADRDDPSERRARVVRDIIRESGVRIPCCALVPVQEIEALLLADVAKLVSLFSWCIDLAQPARPESINDPKEHLIRLTAHPDSQRRPYHPPTHNRVMADLVDLALVEQRCPSFSALAEFVRAESA